MQEYYLLFASSDLTFWNEIVGNPANFNILPISKFLLVKLNYFVLIIALSFVLTRLDEEMARKTASWQLSLPRLQPNPSSPHPYPYPFRQEISAIPSRHQKESPNTAKTR